MTCSRKNWVGIVVLWSLVCYARADAGSSPAKAFDYRHPRPAGSVESGVYGKKGIDFGYVSSDAGVVYDLVAHFPGNEVPPFQVEKVRINGKETDKLLVTNQGVLNLNRRANGKEDLAVHVYAGWKPETEYTVSVRGKDPEGRPVELTLRQVSPPPLAVVRSMSFHPPTPEFPYHHISLVLAKERIESGTVSAVLVDGKRSRNPRFFNAGLAVPGTASGKGVPEGETYTGRIGGTRDFKIVAPCNWTNGSVHSVTVAVRYDSGSGAEYGHRATAPGSGGYWNPAWPHFVSFVVEETAGILRQEEPVHAAIGVFSTDITNPTQEIRVVTLDPTSPKAGPDGYVVAPVQVLHTAEWRDEKAMAIEETDPETGERVHRYDPTVTVELVFFADVQPYEKKVYQVVYGNPEAEPMYGRSDLSVSQGEGLGQTIRTAAYEIGLATNSGAVETVKILGDGPPVLLEHRLETNGAVHWNPGCYAPPTPWVHASDWENPDSREVTGQLLHRTRRYADLPHMKRVDASVSYTFYAGKPYVLCETLLRVKENLFVKALRNAEIVFNHAVLDEFVWSDPSGVVKSLPIEGSRRHPIHALEIPPDTPWMAFISRKHRVGFASIQLEYVNSNLYGDLPSLAQPYFYVQNGPWIYWSRGLVYPFGGTYGGGNFTRLMHVRAGSLYLEKNAWYPFRFADGDHPFREIENLRRQLIHPLHVKEWMATDDRTPDKWVMPILTMPFDEGVEGAISGHKKKSE